MSIQFLSTLSDDDCSNNFYVCLGFVFSICFTFMLVFVRKETLSRDMLTLMSENRINREVHSMFMLTN